MAFIVYNLSSVQKNIKRLKFKNIFPVKTNPDKKILEIIYKIGMPFLVSSDNELKYVRKLFPRASVYYCSPILDQRTLRLVKRLKVKDIIVDSLEQGQSLAVYCEINKYKVNALIRLNTNDLADKALYGVKHYLGCDLESSFRLAEIFSKTRYVNFVGIHAHLTSQNTSIGLWKKYLDFMFKSFVRLGEFKITTLDIGGGLPVSYGKKVLNPSDVMKIIKSLMKKYKVKPKVLAESGRYLVADAGTIVTQVRAVKMVGKDKVVVVDTSAYCSYMDTLIVGLELPIENVSSSLLKQRYVVRGKSPCSLDVFAKTMLNKTKVGDRIILKKAGAYPIASDFMLLKKLPVYYVESNKMLKELLMSI